MKEKGKERSQFYYTSPAANFASEGLDASQSIPIKPSIKIQLIYILNTTFDRGETGKGDIRAPST
jgi:hypothetical protein